jgi:CPA2 family monovalent cation:H+ antiporter-2
VILAAAGGTEAATALLELGLVFVVLAVVARAARRVGLSPIPFYLLVGLLIGEGSPVPLEASDEFIETAATVGVVLLLLFLGLEYTPTELRAGLRANAPAGAVDLLNAIPGIALALLLGWSPLAALVMGGVTYISSSGIIAKLLGDLGRLGNRETPTILSILVLEDLVMAVYLPVLASLVVGGTALVIVGDVVVALVVVALVMGVALRFGDTVSRFLFSRSDEVLLFGILGFTLVVAGAAEQLGVSAGVGAFLVGIALSGAVRDSAATLLGPLRDLFAAAFFVFFTFQIDPATLPAALLPAVVLAVVTALAKVGTGWWAARRNGIGPQGRLRAGMTLVARGEFSIVIAGIAVANEVEGDLGPVTAAYVLVLAVAGPLLARTADPLARRFLTRARRSRPGGGPAPAAPPRPR